MTSHVMHAGSRATRPWARILGLAVFFGLVTGLLEGCLFLVLQQFGRLTYVSVEIIWIAALLDLVLFLAIGLVLIALSLAAPRWPWIRIAVFIFTLAALADWLGVVLAEYVAPWAVTLLAAGLAVRAAQSAGAHEEAFRRFRRRGLPWIAALALVLFIGIQAGLSIKDRLAVARLPSAPAGAPNILFVVVDTLRADHLSAYGYERHTSPNIDRLAEQGVLFENAYAASSYSLPSHASLFTGQHVFEHGADWNTPKAMSRNGYPTIAEALSGLGYRTAGFSANLFWVTREFGLGRGFSHFEDYFRSPADMAFRTFYGRLFERLLLRRLGVEDIPARRRASDITRAILTWVRDSRDSMSKGPEQPFFVFANYMDTHDPYLPPEPFRGRFSAGERPGGLLNERLGRTAPALSADQVQSEVNAYDGGIAYVDDSLGELLAGLEQLGATRDLLVIITSDHGEAFGEHGTFLHGSSVYREEIRVPLILWQPGSLPAGVRVAQTVSNISLPATLMSMVSSTRQPFPGPSLVELTEGGPPSTSGVGTEWPLALSEAAHTPWRPANVPAHSGALKSLIGARWQYIAHQADSPEIYDLLADPIEMHDMAGLPETHEVVAQFEACLRHLLAAGKDQCSDALASTSQSR